MKQWRLRKTPQGNSQGYQLSSRPIGHKNQRVDSGKGKPKRIVEDLGSIQKSTIQKEVTIGQTQ
jgi:hypothetical protein